MWWKKKKPTQPSLRNKVFEFFWERERERAKIMYPWMKRFQNILSQKNISHANDIFMF